MNPVTVSRKFSSRYWDALFKSRDYLQLVDLSSALCGGPAFRADATEYGLPREAFTFVESLLWFAQAWRSSVWTYFESTPPARQAAMLNALETYPAPSGFAEHYALGMRNWQDADAIDPVDQWIGSHDGENNSWLWLVATENRALLERLCT